MHEEFNLIRSIFESRYDLLQSIYLKQQPKPTKQQVKLFMEKLKMVANDTDLCNQFDKKFIYSIDPIKRMDLSEDQYPGFKNGDVIKWIEKAVNSKYPTINKMKNFTYEKYGEMLINLAWIDKDIVKKFNPQTQIPNNDYGFSIQVNLAMLSNEEKDILKTLSDPISFLKEVNYHNRFIINLYPLYDAKDIERIKNLANYEELKEMREMVKQGKQKELIKYIKNNFHQRTKKEKKRIKQEQHFSDIYLDSAKNNKEIGMYNRIEEIMKYLQKEKPYMKKYDKINVNNIKSKVNTNINKKRQQNI